jgi:molybdenum cofactor cytidylyltransferase
MKKTGIILLAAGGSARLGQPKQLLPWKGGTLLSSAAGVALESGLGPVVAVLGASEKECRRALTGLPLRIVVNPAWSEGMGGSISAGMEAFRDDQLHGMLIMLCDQPNVTASTLRALDHHQRTTGAKMVASRYSGTLGPPALFTSPLFPRLIQLRGAAGAKSLFEDLEALESLAAPEAAFDIDTPADLVNVPS